MKTNKSFLSFASVAMCAAMVSAATVNVPAGQCQAGTSYTGDCLVKEGAGTLDLSRAKLDVQKLVIKEGAVRFAADKGPLGAPVTQKARYLRFSITGTRPHAEFSNSGPQYSEFQLFLKGKPVAIPAGTKASGSFVNPQEGPAKAIDGDVKTKYYNPTPLTLDFGREVTFDAYSFVTANDAIGRDPRAWTLEIGTRTKSGRILWQLIGREQDFEAPKERFTPVGKKFTVSAACGGFPLDLAIEVGGKGRLVLDGIGGRFDDLSGSGLIEVKGVGITFAPTCTFTGTVAGAGSANFEK